MEKQTKNIITRAWIASELYANYRSYIRFHLVLCGLILLFCFPLVISLILLVCQRPYSALTKILFSAFWGVSLSLLTLFVLLSLRDRYKTKKMLQRDEFDVVTREVLYKSTEYRRSGGGHTEKMLLHFSGFRKASVDKTCFELTSQGDAFYIVHYKGKDIVELLYPHKMYEYKER